jgi:pyruvate dehydrogenase E2 component (dihydrolipoamide acetyltransferase)
MSGTVQKLGMPKWGLSMTEGRVIEWLVDQGAEIEVGDEVAEVETDKLNGTVESPVAGMIRRHVAAAGDIVPVGGLLAVVADREVSDEEIDAFISEFQASFVPGESEEEAGPAPETVQVPAGSLRFLRQGEAGDAVVLLHGFGGDINNWLFTAPVLATNYTVYALDLPGHGGSTKQVGDGDLDSLVSAVEQFLASQEIERAHLVGHSLGGLLACGLALRDPSRVRSLTLIASAGLGEEINRQYLEQFVSASNRRELKGALELLFADSSLVNRQLVDDVLKYKRIDGVPEALQAISSQVFGNGHQAEVLAPRLRSLEVPMLVIWGTEDRIIPAEQARSAPEGAEVRLLDGSGHSPHMEQAGEVNRIVEEFLAGVPAG